MFAVLTDDVRRHCAAIAAGARHVCIDPDAEVAGGGISGLDAGLHYLDGPPEAVARYVLILDAVNFGSGWFDELGTDTNTLTARLTEHARAGLWSAGELRALDSGAVGEVLGLPHAHRLTQLYAEGLNQLGAWLGDGVPELGDSAEALALRLTEMPFFRDRGFYKRAQIAANDLHHAGLARFGDLARLTVFADNLVPHVLRLDGVLHYDDELAHLVDSCTEIPAGSVFEQELRACAVHACAALARRLGVIEVVLDNWLWNRGQHPPYSERPAHRTRSVFY